MRYTTALLTLTACLALAGCSSSGTSDHKPTATPSSSPTVSTEDQYLTAAHGITFNGAPTDEELLLYPPRWCEELDAGHSVEWMFDMTGGGGLYPIGDEWGTKREDANELLVAGVKAFCPENRDAVVEELRASGGF